MLKVEFCGVISVDCINQLVVKFVAAKSDEHKMILSLDCGMPTFKPNSKVSQLLNFKLYLTSGGCQVEQ
jgi:hypothetical protein